MTLVLSEFWIHHQGTSHAGNLQGLAPGSSTKTLVLVSRPFSLSSASLLKALACELGSVSMSLSHVGGAQEPENEAKNKRCSKLECQKIALFHCSHFLYLRFIIDTTLHMRLFQLTAFTWRNQSASKNSYFLLTP